MIVGGRPIATVFKEEDENWCIHDLVKDTDSEGWLTMAEAKDLPKTS
jgi:hypothetical protein